MKNAVGGQNLPGNDVKIVAVIFFSLWFLFLQVQYINSCFSLAKSINNGVNYIYKIRICCWKIALFNGDIVIPEFIVIFIEINRTHNFWSTAHILYKRIFSASISILPLQMEHFVLSYIHKGL